MPTRRRQEGIEDNTLLDNQSTDPGEGVRIDFVTNLQSGAGNGSGFSYTNHFLTTHFEQVIPQVQGAPSNSVSIVVNAILADNDDVYDSTPSDGLEAGESRAIINQVTVRDVNGGVGGATVTYTFTGDGTQGAISVDFRADGSVSISGLQAGDQYEIDSATDFSAVVIESPGGPTNLHAPLDNDIGFDLGVLAIGRASSGTPIDQSFNIVATDADGDSVGTTIQTTIVPVSPSNSAGTAGADAINGGAGADVLAGNAGNDSINGADGSDTLYGNGGADVLGGGNGNDVLVGGTGTDTLTGGSGSDVFVIDRSALSGTQIDAITDYTAGEVVDITQLMTTGSLSGFVRLTSGGLLQVDANGGGDGFVTIATLAAGVNVTVRYANSASTSATAVVVSGAAPVLLDTNHDGQISYLGVGAGVSFDFDGNGVAEGTAWVGAGDSILVRDADGNGTVSGASEFVFGGAGQTDLEALHAQYGAQLDAGDADFAQFMAWNDANSNGIADAGELTSLTEAGIIAIDLLSDGIAAIAANGDVAIAGTGSFTYVNDNGATASGLLSDVAFRTVERDETLAQRVASNAANAGIVTAAVAAVGLAASQAAAIVHDGGHDLAVVAPQGPVHAIDAPAIASEEAAAALASDDGHGLGYTRSASVDPISQQAVLDAKPAHSGHDQADDLSTLLAPTEAPVSDGASLIAPIIVIPTSEAFEAAAAGDLAAAKTEATVGQLLSEVLDGAAGGGDVDAVLAGLAGPDDGGFAALQALASHEGGGVSAWDMGVSGHLSVNVLANIAADMSAFHHDAVQPAING